MQPAALATASSDVVKMLEPLLAQVEACLQSFGDALQRRDAHGIDVHAQALHQALGLAVQGFAALSAHRDEIPAPLKARLARASAQVASQRECLARATSALDRAMDVLMPNAAPVVYSASGAARAAYGSTGSVRA